jgi:glycogen synthase
VHRFATMAMHLPGVYSTNRAHHPPIPDPLGVRALARIVRQEQPNVIHAHNWIVNSALALRRRASTTRPRFGLVLTLHDFSHICATKRLMRKGAVCDGPTVAHCLSCAAQHYGPAVGPLTATATALMRPLKLRAIDHVVSVSSAVADGNRIPNGPKSSIIPNFIPDDIIPDRMANSVESRITPDLPNGGFLFFAGDLSGEKGLPTLLRAYESLGRIRPPLVLVGRLTPDTPTRLPTGAEMHTEWPHDRVLAAFRRCIFAVLPSVSPDACPTTVLEAMASARPVVTTKTGGIVDMITDGEDGLLVPPQDEYKLAAAMNRLLDDADLRARLATRAQERVQMFTASAVVARIEEVYARVIQPPSIPSQRLTEEPRSQRDFRS